MPYLDDICSSVLRWTTLLLHSSTVYLQVLSPVRKKISYRFLKRTSTPPPFPAPSPAIRCPPLLSRLRRLFRFVLQLPRSRPSSLLFLEALPSPKAEY